MTGALAWNASDATIKTALEGLANIGPGNVDVTGGVVTFQADLAERPVSLLVADGALLTGTGSVTVTGGVATFGGGLLANQDVDPIGSDTTNLTYATAGLNEQVLIQVSADAGTFTLTFGANTTAAQAYTVSAASLQTALRGLASIGAGNVNVTGDNGGPFTVEFVSGKAAQDVGAITANAASLTLNTRAFTIARAQKGSTARSIVVGDTIEAATLRDLDEITPASLSSPAADYNPPGLASAAVVRVSAAVPGMSISGIAGGSAGRQLTLTNVGSEELLLPDEYVTSAAANRFHFGFPSVSVLTLTAGASVTLRWDSVLSRWTIFSEAGLVLSGDLEFSGDPYAPQVKSISAGLSLLGILTPAQITSDQNNYNPGVGYTIYRLTSDAARSITGWSASLHITFWVLNVNALGGPAITLVDNSSSSSTGSRFAFGGNVTINPGEGAHLFYDIAASRWRLLQFRGSAATAAAELARPMILGGV